MQKKAKMSLEKRHNLTGWAFLIPAALLIFIFCFYPMVQGTDPFFFQKRNGWEYLCRIGKLPENFKG